MSLIADNEAEHAKLVGGEPQHFLLGLAHRHHRLIGGEHHLESVLILDADKLSGDVVGIGAGGIGEVESALVGIGSIGAIAGASVGGVVGADTDGGDVLAGIGAPCVERLSQQGDAGHHEQHQPVAAGHGLGNLQCGVGLAGAAGHDELATVVRGEIVHRLVHGYGLMLHGLFAGQCGLRAVEPVPQLLPVDGRIGKVAKADAAERDGLSGGGLAGVASEHVGGAHPKATGEMGGLQGIDVGELPSGGGDEGIDHGFGDDGALLVAFALNGPVVALNGSGHKVDAGVVAAKVGTCGEIGPHPHFAELAGIAGVGKQPVGYQPFKLVTFIPFGKCATTNFFEYRREIHIYRMID